MAAPIRVAPILSDEELWDAYRKEKDARVARRILYVIKAKELGSANKAAKELHVTHRTICWWVKRYNEGGLEALRDKPRTGRPKTLTEELIDEALSHSPKEYGYPYEAWSVTLLHVWLKEHKGIEYHRNTLYKRIRKFGYSLVTPRPQHRKADEQERNEFKKK